MGGGHGKERDRRTVGSQNNRRAALDVDRQVRDLPARYFHEVDMVDEHKISELEKTFTAETDLIALHRDANKKLRAEIEALRPIVLAAADLVKHHTILAPRYYRLRRAVRRAQDKGVI